MHEPFLNSGWDTFFVAATFLGILLLAFFRLDAHLAMPRRRRATASAFGVSKRGRAFLTDPDGRPSYPASRGK
jgi:hypothetical protein